LRIPAVSAPRITVCCIKWGEGYGVEYANVLARAVRDHLSLPHRFACITDHAHGLDPAIVAIPLPEFPLDREKWNIGMWPKLAMFEPSVFRDDELVLYVDLDVMIVGRLEPLIERVRERGGLHIIRNWNPTPYNVVPTALRPDRGSNSSVVAFVPGEQRHIWDRFIPDPDGNFVRFRNDQRFINAHAVGKQYWPGAWCQSFRRSCVWHYPVSRIFPTPSLPGRARILVFHGRPKPTDLLGPSGRRWGTKWKFGTEPVPWVQEYWAKYSDGDFGNPPTSAVPEVDVH
jgi:hypothetical protein